MNTQPSPFVSNIFAMTFVALVIYYFFKSFNDPSKHINIKGIDLINVGYVENPTICLIDNRKKLDFTSTQLFKDCVSALNALGMKKTEAKNTTVKIFNDHDPQPQSVQEFLMIALRKN